jgi:glycosyltransferase involved in cell wall biosynthesis
MQVTIAICTWNRCELLDQTLTQLGRVDIPTGLEWELVVVNNACTDATDDVLGKHQSLLPLRRIYQPQPGTCHARNSAIEAAQGDLIVWTDDDVLVSNNWLTEYLRAARQWPNAAYFGGMIEPLYSIEPPRWIRENLDLLLAAYAVFRADETIRPLREHEHPFGANMATRREALAGFRFDPRFGPTQNDNIRGEETELFAQLRRAGGLGIWVGTAHVKHYLPPKRLTLDYIRDYYYGYGRTEERRVGPRPGRTWRGAPLWAVRESWQYAIGASLRSWRRDRRWLEAYRRAQITRGIVDEARARSTQPPQPSSASRAVESIPAETVSAC